MGFIVDLDFPHALPGPSRGRRTSRAGRSVNSPRTISHDTPLVPCAAAEAVWEEACLHLGEPLPAAWIKLLAQKAEAIYEHAPRYRRQIRGSGDTGREWLWAFMRHWLAALIQEHRPRLYPKLPPRYCVGQP